MKLYRTPDLKDIRQFTDQNIYWRASKYTWNEISEGIYRAGIME